MIYDISQEVFASNPYPGDPVPEKTEVCSMKKSPPDACQLTRIVLGSHTGTHLDAPCHFIPNGKDAEQIELNKCVGRCLVVSLNEIDLKSIERWKELGIRKILLKNGKKINIQEALLLAQFNVECIGVEANTIGEDDENGEVHRILLLNEMVILEGLCMEMVPVGEYYLSALPLRMKTLDGSPVRAVLISQDREEM